MTDSIDEWDGGAIDGRDQYLADAPYWNGDGETVDGTDPDATGEVVTENVPSPGDEPETNDADESESDDPEIPTWPPNAETLTEIRQRLLDGASTSEVGEWVEISCASIQRAATEKRRRYADIEADIPPLTTEGNSSGAKWVIDERDESQSERTDDDPELETEEVDTVETDESETEGAEVPVWPPNPETLTELRRRLLDGASTESLADNWSVVSNGAIYTAAIGETYADVNADIPPLRTVGEAQHTEWVIDEDGETQSEPTVDDFGRNESGGSWPPTAAQIDDIRQRLVNGESTAEIAEEYSDVGKDAINRIAKADTHKEHLARSGTETPPVRYIKSEGWTWTEPVDLETETTDNDDSDPESETADSADKWGGCWMGTDHYLRDAPHWNGDGEAVDATDSDPEPKSETGATDAEEEPEPEPGLQESRLVSGDERPVARDPPEPETPTVPTRWIVAGVAFATGWILSRLVRGGDGE
jgi:hypothetical protein